MGRIVSGKVKSAQKAVVYGPEGIGKTTIGAAFPGALLLDVERGSGHLDCQRIVIKDWSDFMAVLDEIYEERDSTYKDFQTIAIDTADWLERLATDFICERADVSGIEAFGYGKGYVFLMEEIGFALSKLDMLVNAGRNVVVIAHSQVQKRELPGELGAFDRHELKCTKRVTALIKEWADAVLFVNYKIDVETDAEGRTHAFGGTKRQIMTTHTAAYDAKNRWSLNGEFEVGPVEDPIPDEIKAHVAGAEDRPEAAAETDPFEEALAENGLTMEDVRAVMKKQGIKKLTAKVKGQIVAQIDKVSDLAKELREGQK